MFRWQFLKSTAAISKLEVTDSLPRARLADLGTVLSGHGFQVFAKGPTLYAFKGLPGRLAPIGVHAALLLIMAGILFPLVLQHLSISVYNYGSTVLGWCMKLHLPSYDIKFPKLKFL